MNINFSVFSSHFEQETFLLKILMFVNISRNCSVTSDMDSFAFVDKKLKDYVHEIKM